MLIKILKGGGGAAGREEKGRREALPSVSFSENLPSPNMRGRWEGGLYSAEASDRLEG